jgi:hypothetical protein
MNWEFPSPHVRPIENVASKDFCESIRRTVPTLKSLLIPSVILPPYPWRDIHRMDHDNKTFYGYFVLQ